MPLLLLTIIKRNSRAQSKAPNAKNSNMNMKLVKRLTVSIKLEMENRNCFSKNKKKSQEKQSLRNLLNNFLLKCNAIDDFLTN